MRKLKIKDIIMVALLTAVYLVFYLISGMSSMVFGAFGHAISPGVCGLLGGCVLYFMSRKIGKFGQFTILTAIIMLVFSLMGAGYLPWLITSMIAAVIADFIASKDNKVAAWKVAVASGIMHVGQAWGAIVPSWFFVESYKKEWIERGQTPEDMEAMAAMTQGIMGVLATVVVFALAFAGVYLGYLILRKHFKEN